MSVETIIRDALSRSIGFHIDSGNDNWSGNSSLGYNGTRTMQNHVFQLILDFAKLPELWFDTLKYELRKLKTAEITLSGTRADDLDPDQYEQYTGTLNDFDVECPSKSPEYKCVKIRVDENCIVRILLRNRTQIED